MRVLAGAWQWSEGLDSAASRVTSFGSGRSWSSSLPPSGEEGALQPEPSCALLVQTPASCGAVEAVWVAHRLAMGGVQLQEGGLEVGGRQQDRAASPVQACLQVEGDVKAQGSCCC